MKANWKHKVGIFLSFFVGVVIVLLIVTFYGAVMFAASARVDPDNVYSLNGPDIQNVTMTVSRWLIWANITLSHPHANLHIDSGTWLICLACESVPLNGAITIRFLGDGTVEIVPAPGWNVEAKGK